MPRVRLLLLCTVAIWLVAIVDAQALARAAHSVKGTVRSFEARRASTVAECLEAKALAGDLNGAAEIFVELEQQIDQLGIALGKETLA
jgi:hypothetical protein